MALFKSLLTAAFLAFLLCPQGVPAGWGPKFTSIQEQFEELEEAASKRIAEVFGAAMDEAKAGLGGGGGGGDREELEDEDEDDSRAGTAELDAEVPPPSAPKEDVEETGIAGNPFGMMPDLFSIFRIPQEKPWWSGEHVCVERETKEEDKEKDKEKDKEDGIFVLGTAQFSSCRYTQTKYICTTVTHTNGVTKTSTVTYQCCHGYRRSKKGPGCTKFETKPAMDVADEMGGGRFATMVKSAGLADKMEEGNLTVFVPTDEAFKLYETGLEPENQIDTQGKRKGLETNNVEDMVAKSEKNEKEFIMNHFVPGIIESSDFQNDMVLKTIANTTLRINAYPRRRSVTLTVNCAPVVATDTMTNTGVVHTLGRVVQPADKSVFEILSQPKYSKFVKMLEEHELLEDVKGDGPLTVFALNNEAMDGVSLKKGCAKQILKHHILPHAVCTEAASQGNVSASDRSGHWLQLSKSEGDGRVLLDGTVPVVEADMVASNGVVHRVEKLVVPPSAKTVKEVLEGSNHTRFLKLLEGNGLLEEAEAGGSGFVMFVAPDSALDDATLAELEASGKIKDVLRYHIASENGDDCRLKDGLTLKTLLKGKEVSIRADTDILSGLLGSPQAPTAQCVPLTRLNGRVCSGVLHEVARLMTPPEGSLYDLVQQRKEFAAFKEVLNGTKLEEEMKSGMKGGVTLLVPTEEALKKMGDGNYDTLIKDKLLADQILRAHVLAEPVCCSGVRANSWPFTPTVRTLGGSAVAMNRRRSGDVTFAGVGVDECDMTATDGVAHLVSGVMLPAGQRMNTDIIFKKPNSEIILTGF